MPTLPGGSEWLIILFLVLLLFGAKKLPGLARSFGTSLTEFRRASRTDDELAVATNAD
jgi:sec-independent protein translocase protein TatA